MPKGTLRLVGRCMPVFTVLSGGKYKIPLDYKQCAINLVGNNTNGH